MRYTTEELKSEFKRLNYQWLPFHFIGIRSKANEKNRFDDTFILVNGDILHHFTCTTDPGVHWLKNLLNPKGTAVLKPNQYLNTWALGMHQNKYKAFCQVRAVEVYRDKNLDDKAEETATIDKGLFGINIHRASETMVSQLVDKWSAGCQVLNNPSEFKFVLSEAERSLQKEFTYTLLKEF